MRVLTVTPYYNPEGGGLERYAHEIGSRLAADGHDVRALSFTTGSARTDEQDGVAVERLEPLARLGNTPIHPSFPLQAGRRIERHEPDVVLAHTPVPFPAESAYLAARRHDVPFVLTYHAGQLRGGSPLFDGLAAADRWTLQRLMLAGADRLVAVSPHVRDQALDGHQDRTTVIPPGVDTERFFPAERDREDRVLFVGPLDSAYRWKGIDVLLEALPRVRGRRPDAELTIVGDGDRYEDLAEHAEATSTPIDLLGRVSDQQLVEAYRQADVTVLPSTSDAESFGMVLAEANACGCPVVASDVGGVSSFVRDGENGLLAQPGDPEDLAAKITRVLEDPEQARRMGQRGREIVLEDHDWDELTDRMDRVLHAATRQHGPSLPMPGPGPVIEASAGASEPSRGEPR